MGFGQIGIDGHVEPRRPALDAAQNQVLPRTAEAILEQIVGDQFAEYAAALPAPIAQNAGNGNLRVVIQNRLGNTAEEGKGRDMPVAKASVVSPG